jgi:phospholipid/cholesterol/gamma-HCH transport system permease protein
MVAARVGAGIASEIGSMMVTQQIDAMRALGTSPIKKIVIPRVLACMITVPLLAVMANVVGILGALLVGVMELKLDAQFFMLKVATLTHADFAAGFAKTFFFAAFISITSCYMGMNVQEGTKGVGTATTKAVVASSIMVLIGDYFLTRFFWIIERWI